jgi:hypothetical protein
MEITRDLRPANWPNVDGLLNTNPALNYLVKKKYIDADKKTVKYFV